MSVARLGRDARGATALEFAIVFPTFLVFVFGMFSIYSLTSARRAMDFGIDRALRYLATHSSAASGSASNVLTAYCNGAAVINGDVGNTATACVSAALTISPSTFSPGTWVTLTATYTWVPPTGNGTGTVPQFVTTTMTASGKIRVMN